MLRITAVAAATLLLVPAIAQAQTRRGDALIVYGDGWEFSVREPPGWHGDCAQAARWKANIIFYRDTAAIAEGSGLIRVVIAAKADENTGHDLEQDMVSYRRDSPGVQFSPLAVTHPRYAVFAKLFAVPGTFYEYVTYLNPGPTTPHLISVAYNSATKAASPDELRAYRAVVASVSVLR